MGYCKFSNGDSFLLLSDINSRKTMGNHFASVALNFLMDEMRVLS